jgi:hypothetical protein
MREAISKFPAYFDEHFRQVKDFKILTAATMEITVLKNITPCRQVSACRRIVVLEMEAVGAFEMLGCLHGVKSQTNVILYYTALSCRTV